MNISEKNTKILAFITIVLLLLVFYFIPYKQLDAKKLKLEKEVANLTSTYDVLAQDMNKKEEYLKGIDELKLEIVEMDKKLPAELTQEMMLYTLDDMEKTIGIKIPSASFSVLLPVFDEEKELLTQQTDSTDTKKDASKDTDAKTEDNAEDNTVDKTEDNIADKTETKTETKTEAKTETNTKVNKNKKIIYADKIAVKCDVTTSTILTYSQLKDLMDYLYGADGHNDKNRNVINKLSLTSNTETGELTASFTLSFFALYSVDRVAVPVDLGPFELEKKGVFLPFDEYGVKFSIDEQKTQANSTVDKASDFFMMLSPITADQTTVYIGQTAGTSTAPLVREDNKDFLDVEFVFNQKNGKYYFSYKAGTEKYPNNYAEGVAFEPGNAIELSVLSNKRNGANDTSGANVTIINNTDKPLSVITSYDDKEKPRFKLVKSVGNVNVK